VPGAKLGPMSAFAPDQASFYLDEPYRHFRRLRREDPVCWSEGSGGMWCLLKHAEIATVSRDPQRFTSTRGIQQGLGDQSERPLGIPPTILEMDPPAHNRYRKLVMQSFAPRAIARLEPRVREIARESLDGIAFGETVDFVDRVSVPLPMFVIAEMLGVPREDRRDFERWSNSLIDVGGGNETPENRAALGEMLRYFQEMLDARRRDPRDDLISTLAHAEIDGDRLAEPDLLMFCVTLLVAGNETTRNLISGGTLLLMEHPDQRRRLERDPTLLPNAIEEMLRWWTPVHSFTRTATRDTELRGRAIREGQNLLLLYASANRDEEVWGADADAFDIARDHTHRRHLAFGFGEHLCLGASLARLEARVAFEELLARRPRFEQAGEVERLPSRLMHGVTRLPVVFTDSAAAGTSA